MKTSSRLNPKSEDRRPKQIRNPKPQYSVFGVSSGRVGWNPFRASAFGLWSSGFAPVRSRQGGYLLVEALVYIGLVFLLLGIGTAAMFRTIDNSVALRRNADDISRAVHLGELWRGDVRTATHGIRFDKSADEPLFRLEGDSSEVDYRYSQDAIYRRIGDGPWSRVLERVQSSSMEREQRPTVTVWRWELELRPQTHGSFKPGRVRPLFTFLAVEPELKSQ